MASGVKLLHSRRFGSKSSAEACSAVDILPIHVNEDGLGGYKHEFASEENYNDFPPTVSPRPSSSTYYPTYLPSVTARPTIPLGVVPEEVGGDSTVSVNPDSMVEFALVDLTTSNVARRVKIHHDTNPEGILSMKEVEIYDAEGINVAVEKGVASQSSNYSEEHTAEKAIDGDFDTFSHTQSNGYNEWWEVDLGRDVAIDRIVITNRDCEVANCLVRLSYAVMDLLDDSGKVVARRNFYDTSQMNVLEFSFLSGVGDGSVPQQQDGVPTYSPTYLPSVTARPTAELPSAGSLLDSPVEPAQSDSLPTYSPTYLPSVTAKPTAELPSAGSLLDSPVEPAQSDSLPTYSPTYLPSVTAKPTAELPSAGSLLDSSVSIQVKFTLSTCMLANICLFWIVATYGASTIRFFTDILANLSS